MWNGGDFIQHKNKIKNQTASENTYFESRNSRHLENWRPYWISIDTIEFFQSEYIHFDVWIINSSVHSSFTSKTFFFLHLTRRPSWKLAAILDFQLDNVLFLESTSWTSFVPNLVLVPSSERFLWNIDLIYSTIKAVIW